MLGTLVNVGAIVVGALLGLVLKKGIPNQIRDSLIKAEGLAIVLIGVSSVLGEMFSVDLGTGGLVCNGGLLLLVSLVLGCVIGELLRIDDRINAAGLRIEQRFAADDGFAKGLVTAALLFCIGAMSVIGPINDGLAGDRTILYIKSTLDFTTALVLTSVLGIGVLFAAIPVLVFQAIPALLAKQLAPLITPELLSSFCMVGYSLVTVMGINFLSESKVKTANLLPALLVPVGHYCIFG